MKEKELRIADIIISTLLCICIAIFLINIELFVDIGLPSVVSPVDFPFFVSFVLFICAVLYLVKSFSVIRKRHNGILHNSGEDPDIAADADDRPFACVIYIAILYGYYFLILFAGFIISTPIVMLAVSAILGARRFYVLIPAYTAFSLLMYYVSLKAMKIALPAGMLFS